jgi:DNA repair exonuclease SbcCD ATPase subunit
MRIVLRIFIPLMVILSGVSLWLGIELYQQREQLKGRAQKMERSLQAIAQQAAAPQEPFIEAIAETVDPAVLMDYWQMDSQLQKVQNIVVTRYNELSDTYDVLQQTRDKLAATEQELAQTKQELAQTRQELAETRERLASTQAELAEANRKIATLEGTVAELNAEISRQKDEIAKLEDEKQALFDEKTQLEVILERLLKDSATGVMRPGLTGKIVAANPEWNFVILDVGYKDGAKIAGEMIVHRNEQIVGRVRIVDIRERMSIANIKRDWQQMPIQEGDRVVY